MKVYEFALKMRDMASAKVAKLHRLTGKTKAGLERLRDQAGRTADRFREKFPVAVRSLQAVGQQATRVTRKMGALGQTVSSKTTPLLF